MFTHSSHKRCWLFASSDPIEEMRIKANRTAIQSLRDDYPDCYGLLSVEDELLVCRVIEDTAQKFCKTFHPPMPMGVVWTAFNYFKRFFMKRSVMEFVAKSVMMTSIYLASKTEEFNISINDFVANLKSGTKESNMEVILAMELEVMHNIDYQLIIHTPYRPLEGHLIDIKTRFPSLNNPEHLRSDAMEFLSTCLLTDVSFLYPPSQIALAALVYAAKMQKQSLNGYIALLSEDPAVHQKLMNRIDGVVRLVSSYQPVGKDEADVGMNKLRSCIQNLADMSSLHQRRRKTDGSDDSDLDEPPIQFTAE